ncbi:MFS transporter, partial [bacterium]|nr:MFS transporter [bacterium]
MSASRNLLVRNKDFRFVWIAQVLSQAGSRAYFINLLWWIVTSTGASNLSRDHTAAWASGVLLIIMGLPPVVLVKWIGKTLGRHSSKNILVGFEVCGAVLTTVVLGLAWSGNLSLPWIYALSILIATCQAFVDPALIKSVPELVDREDVESAVAFESSTQALAFFSGAALGAVASGTLGFTVTVGLNALSYGISAWLTSRARFRHGPQPAGSDSAQIPTDPIEPQNQKSQKSQKTKSLPAEVTPLLRAFAVANIFMFPLFLILPLFVKESLGGSVLLLGLLESCFWLGILIGANQSSRLPVWGGYLRMSGILFALFGALVCTIILVPHPFWVALVMACGGAGAG